MHCKLLSYKGPVFGKQASQDNYQNAVQVKCSGQRVEDAVNHSLFAPPVLPLRYFEAIVWMRTLSLS